MGLALSQSSRTSLHLFEGHVRMYSAYLSWAVFEQNRSRPWQADHWLKRGELRRIQWYVQLGSWRGKDLWVGYLDLDPLPGRHVLCYG